MASCVVEIENMAGRGNASGSGIISPGPGVSTESLTTDFATDRLPKRAGIVNVIALYKKYPTSPVERLVHTHAWRHDLSFQMLNPQGTVVQQGLSYCRGILNSQSTGDIYKMYTVCATPMFVCANATEYAERYLDRVMTYLAVLELLGFQFDNDFNAITTFCTNLLNVCDRVSGKQNSMWVKGAVSAGKNFLFDAVCTFSLNVGYISNPIRHNIFAFMDCVDRRVIMWNEAQCDSYFYEEVKGILGGDSPKVNVKNQGPKVITKTPIFVLSNRNTFPDTAEFNARLFKYVWKTCPMLKQWGCKKPNPIFTMEVVLYLSDYSGAGILKEEIIHMIIDTISTVLDIELQD